jgi:hypothetical protein
MKRYYYIITILIALFSFGFHNQEANPADDEPFSYLTKLKITDHGICIKYDPAITKVYNTKIEDIKPGDPFYYEEYGMPPYNVKLLKTKINRNSDTYYYVLFSHGPSGDPHFMIFEDGRFDKPVFTVYALKLYINGSGNIYSEGHTNNMFNERRKFQFINGEFVETEQPYYYVGLKTVTNTSIKLYKTEQMKEVVASLPKNYSVEVVINKPKTQLFLIKTDFGLTGWYKPEHAMYGRQDIKGLYYAGD